jgi:hypothetical protein
LSRRVKEGFA